MEVGDIMVFNGTLVKIMETDFLFYGEPSVEFVWLLFGYGHTPGTKGLVSTSRIRPLTWFDKLWHRKNLRLIRGVDKIVEACVQASNEG